MTTTTAAKTIEALQAIFARYGLPEQHVSDNGPQFTSDDFSQFMTADGIKHIRCASCHPSSNGLAERFVQTFKKGMKAGTNDGQGLVTRLSRFLLGYRSTPHATTNLTPSELLKPSTEDVVTSKQAHQKMHHDLHSKLRVFSPGDHVMVRYFHSSSKWLTGIIVDRS